jgi:hypothetical protein
VLRVVAIAWPVRHWRCWALLVLCEALRPTRAGAGELREVVRGLEEVGGEPSSRALEVLADRAATGPGRPEPPDW